LNIGTGTLTPMIMRMEANGWLRKQRLKEDERKVYIHLQKKASEEKQAITKEVGKVILSCNIELEEYEQLMQQLNHLHMKLKKRKK
jgi:MarR family transcriptional regulator, organic hydroperoxide resistance regulator